eukprot:295693-Rhodomonas_salina.1
MVMVMRMRMVMPVMAMVVVEGRTIMAQAVRAAWGEGGGFKLRCRERTRRGEASERPRRRAIRAVQCR